jgi:hypothetical protein
MLVVWLASRKWLFTGLSQCFFEEAGNEGAVVANRLLDVGSLTHHPHAGAEQLRRGLHTRGEEERRKLHDLLHVWRRTVRICRRGEFGRHISAWFAPSVADVFAELVVQSHQRIVRHRIGGVDITDDLVAEHSAELGVVLEPPGFFSGSTVVREADRRSPSPRQSGLKAP